MNIPSLLPIKQQTSIKPDPIQKKSRKDWYNNNYASRTKSKTDPVRSHHKKNKMPPKLRNFYIPDIECPDCKTKSNILSDPKSGYLVCNSCGLVVQKQLISNQSEWRTFADNDKNGPDPNRVGQAIHYLLTNESDFSTIIRNNGTSDLPMMQSLNTDRNKKLHRGLYECSSICKRLNLNVHIKNSASELFKDLLEFEEFKGKSSKCIIICCVYIVAKIYQCDQPLKELCAEFEINRSQVKKIHTAVHKLKAYGKIKIHKKRGRNLKQRSTAEIYGMRYANNLKLNVSTIKNVQYCIRICEGKGFLIGKQPQTIAGSVIYFVGQCCFDDSQRRTVKEICAEAKVSEKSIYSAFKNYLHERRMSLIPVGNGSGYVNGENQMKPYFDLLRVRNLKK